MKRAATFDSSILTNTDNHFAIQAVYKKHITIDICVPQREIAETLQSHLDSLPKRLDVYWSSAPVYRVIVDDLYGKDITDFERLNQLIKRCPHLLTYTFNPRKTTNYD